MSLHIHAEVEQRSGEWYEQRRGMITASAVKHLLSVDHPGPLAYDCPDCEAPADAPCMSKGRNVPQPIATVHSARSQWAAEQAETAPLVITTAATDTSAALTAAIVAERVTGIVIRGLVTSDMWRGIIDEPYAREAYAAHHKVTVDECGFMVRDDWGYSIGYSPDGLVGDDGLIEIKSRLPKIQVQTVIDGDVPREHMAQIQCGLLVSGREWCDYVSFSGGLPLVTVRVLPDPLWHAAIVTAVAAFEASAADLEARYRRAADGLPMTEPTPDPFEEVH